MNRQLLLLPPGRMRPVSMAVSALVLAAAVALSVISWATAMPGNVAVRVGDHDITINALEHRADVLSAIYGVTAPTKGAELSKYQRATAKSVAISTLISDLASQRDIVIADKTVQDALTKIIMQKNGDRASFVAFLGQKGLKESDILDELRRSLETQKLFTAVTADVPAATEADAKKEYAAHPDQMRSAQKRRLANIVVKTRKQAESVVKRLKGGAAFADVASSTSLDTSTSRKGGDLGKNLVQSDLETAYGKAAFAAKSGAIFGPVKTQSGWNVGRVLKVVPGKKLPYATVKAQLISSITTQRQQQAWVAWLNKKIEAAHITYADHYRPSDQLLDIDETEAQPQ